MVDYQLVSVFAVNLDKQTSFSGVLCNQLVPVPLTITIQIRVRLNKYGQGTGLLRFLQSTCLNSLIKKSLVCALIKQDETYPSAIIRNFAQILYRIILIDMRMSKHYIILLLTALILCTCGSLEADKTLADVGAYINERPDSALNVLQSMSERNLNTRELKARHSLLYTMALDKNYIDTTDIEYAKAQGLKIKLLASSRKTEHGIWAMVAPMLVSAEM